MHDPARMRSRQPATRLDDDVRGARHRQRPVPNQQTRQILAFEVLHHQVGRAVVGSAEIQRGADVLVLDAARGFGFVAEAGHGFRVLRQVGVQELDGEAAADDRVLRFIHLAHAALAQPPAQPVLSPDYLACARAGRAIRLGHDTLSGPGVTSSPCRRRSSAPAEAISR